MDLLIKNEENNNSKQGARNSNIEWLRIISMLLIIAFHATRNGYTGTDQPLLVYSTGILFGSWGLLGVDLFLITSAWFLSSQKFRSIKVIHIVFQVFTWVFAYSVLNFFYDAFYCRNGVQVALFNYCKQSVVGFFQPLWCNCYWFVTTYFFMLLAMPLLNKILEKTDKKQLQKVLLIFIFVPIYAQFGTSVVCDIIYFLYVYLFVGYIKRYGCSLLDKYAKPLFCVAISTLIFLSKLLLYFLPEENSWANFVRVLLKNTIAAIGRHSMIILILSLIIFFTVLKLKPSYNSTVNKIASHTLGVYLFHEANVMTLPNPLNVITGQAIKFGFLIPDFLFPIRYLTAVLAVFFVGTICEWVRDIFLQKPFIHFVSTKWGTTLNRIDDWFNGN